MTNHRGQRASHCHTVVELCVVVVALSYRVSESSMGCLCVAASVCTFRSPVGMGEAPCFLRGRISRDTLRGACTHHYTTQTGAGMTGCMQNTDGHRARATTMGADEAPNTARYVRSFGSGPKPLGPAVRTANLMSCNDAPPLCTMNACLMSRSWRRFFCAGDTRCALEVDGVVAAASQHNDYNDHGGHPTQMSLVLYAHSRRGFPG